MIIGDWKAFDSGVWNYDDHVSHYQIQAIIDDILIPFAKEHPELLKEALYANRNTDPTSTTDRTRDSTDRKTP